MFYKNDPLKITHGKGAYMYDERGNQYLDGVNNVAHGKYTTGVSVSGFCILVSYYYENFLSVNKFCDKSWLWIIQF